MEHFDNRHLKNNSLRVSFCFQVDRFYETFVLFTTVLLDVQLVQDDIVFYYLSDLRLTKGLRDFINLQLIKQTYLCFEGFQKDIPDI